MDKTSWTHNNQRKQWDLIKELSKQRDRESEGMWVREREKEQDIVRGTEEKDLER